MLKKYLKKFIKTKNSQKIITLIVVLLVAVGGSILLIGSHAASPYASINADNGTVVGANKQACAGSNDGTCVVFGSAGTGGGGGGSGKNWYVATNGSDSNACTQASPCLTFNHAYDIAGSGDTVLLSSGTYGGQTIAWQAAKQSLASNVTIEPASGASVYLSGDITVLSSHVTFANLIMGDPNSAANKGPNKAPYAYPSNTAANIANYPDQWADKHDVIVNDYPLGGAEPNDNKPGDYNDVSFVTFQNIIARNFEVNGAHDISVLGGSYGPAAACDTDQSSLPQYGGGNNAIRVQQTNASGINNTPGKGIDPYNLTVDGVTVHNVMSYLTAGASGCHTEGIAVFAGTSNMKILDSKFYQNDVFDFFTQTNSGAATVAGITLENNWFADVTSLNGQGSGYYAVAFDGTNSDFANSLVENNSINGYVDFIQSGNPSYTNFKVIGNIGTISTSSSGCSAGPSLYNYNVWTNSSCGTGDINLGGAAPFVTSTNDSTMNYALKPGVSAINFVPTSAYASPLTNDIDYHCRPASGQTKNDAGASELNATGTCNKPF